MLGGFTFPFRQHCSRSLERLYPLCQLVRYLTVWQICGMNILSDAKKHKNHRFPVEIISHAVWLYFRFCLSFRDVEELLLERGVVVTYEAIRKWCRKFGQQYANQDRKSTR